MSPVGLLSLALLAPAAPADPFPLRPGDEFCYTGTVIEVVDRPGNRFRRSHDLEVRILVLERWESSADVAVLTLLRRAEDPAVAGAVPVVTGAGPDRAAQPPAARLDLLRVHADGTAHLILPAGPPPLKFAPDTPARPLPAAPLDSFAPFEFGMFPPRVPAAADKPWTVGSADPARPAETWQALPPEFLNAERCARLQLVQQTADWEKPRGGQVSWQRVDAVWVSTQDGAARRIHRVIRQRDGIAASPAVWIEVKYDLKDQSRVTGRMGARYRQEVELAYSTAAEIAALLREPARLDPRVFQTRLAKLDDYLKGNDPGTPYREALLALRRQLAAAVRGEVTPATAPGMPPGTSREPAVGQPAPDVQAGGFHLAACRGKPVVLMFFCPGTETADLSLAVADALQKRYVDRVAVAPLVVFAEPAAGVKDRDRLKLTVAVYDGATAGAAYGVDSFPRFVVIDPVGKVRWSFAGVGAETGFLIREEVDRLVAPPGTAPLPGTGSPIGPPTSPPPPRP